MWEHLNVDVLKGAVEHLILSMAGQDTINTCTYHEREVVESFSAPEASYISQKQLHLLDHWNKNGVRVRVKVSKTINRFLREKDGQKLQGSMLQCARNSNHISLINFKRNSASEGRQLLSVLFASCLPSVLYSVSSNWSAEGKLCGVAPAFCIICSMYIMSTFRSVSCFISFIN